MCEYQYPAFFTATILSWKKLLQPDKYKQIIADSLNFLVQDGRVWVYGFVIMPNHIHVLWRMRKPHLRENVQRDFLKFTAQKIKIDLHKNYQEVLVHLKSTQNDRLYQIWERNPLSIYCYSIETVEQKLNYIHQNPVNTKWNLADIPENYHYSSARYYFCNQDDFQFITHYRE
jgi:REP element-mobilizing transposase RayT